MLLGLSLFGLLHDNITFCSDFAHVCTGVGTFLCGLAPSMDGLIIARAIAGMGGGG